jgi:hypothetical protein
MVLNFDVRCRICKHIYGLVPCGDVLYCYVPCAGPCGDLLAYTTVLDTNVICPGMETRYKGLWLSGLVEAQKQLYHLHIQSEWTSVVFD